jgi:hypothetical protein
MGTGKGKKRRIWGWEAAIIKGIWVHRGSSDSQELDREALFLESRAHRNVD